jgi:hypothetical protein
VFTKYEALMPTHYSCVMAARVWEESDDRYSITCRRKK